MVRRVRVSKCGWSMAMGPLRRKQTRVGNQGVCVKMVDDHGPLEKEPEAGWKGQGVEAGMVDG
jgi:hypothetical protein